MQSSMLPLHPLCSFFPRIEGQEFEELKADIATHGQRDEIVLYQGMVLDGGNRARACAELGREPKTKEFDGNDPVAYVLSKNLRRRHLTPGQAAVIVSAAADWSTAHTRGRPSDAAREKAATLPLSSVGSRREASGASERTQRMADKVTRTAPELAKEVAAGHVTLPQAVRQVDRMAAGQDAPPPPPPTRVTRQVAAAPPAPPTDLPDDSDLLADLHELQQRNATLEAELSTVTSGSPESKALHFQRLYEHAKAEQSAAMERANNAADIRDWYARQLKRCGKAVGQDDPDKVAAAVEAFVRKHQSGKVGQS